MSRLFQVGSSWKGFPALRYLVIFGDSYSDVGFRYKRATPSASQPLGVKFPGSTFTEPEKPNWVGHLITKYSPPPRFDPAVEEDELDSGYLDSPLLVYDYAVGGETVAGVRKQVERSFLPMLGSKPLSAPWKEEDTLFVTWVGINDVGRPFADPVASIEDLFASQEILYDAGARNYLFIDVPPIQRSPALSMYPSSKFAARYENWNSTLRQAIDKFCNAHDDVSVFLFSSYQLFDTFLSRPLDFDLKSDEVQKAGGEVWIDHLHPTSKIHDIIASNLGSFLDQIGPQPTEI